MTPEAAPQFLVAQLGARMHYAVPRMLSSARLLAHLYTDSIAPRPNGFVDRVLGLAGSHSRSIRRFSSRRPDGIAPERIKAFQSFGYEYAMRLRLARFTGGYKRAFLWAGKEFNHLVVRQPWHGAQAVYVFNSAGLEILQTARQRGMTRFMEQTIAPSALENKLLDEEYAGWPGWQAYTEATDVAQAYADREQREWDLADRILCGSEFVVEGIRQVGGSWQKCVVVPYGVDCTPAPIKSFSTKPQLNVLFAGELGLRKGAQYFCRAAGLLPPAHYQFRMVGPSRLSEVATRSVPRHVTLLGAIPRPAMAEQYQWADVLVLPSICEGSATVTYEALAAGIPVIATRNAGTVLRDGVDGFIVPARDPDAIAAKLELLHSQSELLRQMSLNARARAAEFTIEKYAERLLGILKAPAIELIS
jgi:glycosyltransferase involved in cell wall biosynthesis